MVVVWHEMDIGAKRESGIVMAQHYLDALHVKPGAKPSRRGRVPQSVEAS
jgi:hypothetical protein